MNDTEKYNFTEQIQKPANFLKEEHDLINEKRFSSLTKRET